MRRTILFGILSVLILSMVLQVTANLVGTAGPIPGLTVTPVPTPTPEPTPMPTISPGPLVLSNNMASDTLPAFVDSNNVLDPISAATLDNAMSMFWQPASGSGVSPLQAIPVFDVSGLTMSPVEQVMGSAVGPVPFSGIFPGDMSWLFSGA